MDDTINLCYICYLYFFCFCFRNIVLLYIIIMFTIPVLFVQPHPQSIGIFYNIYIYTYTIFICINYFFFFFFFFKSSYLLTKLKFWYLWFNVSIPGFPNILGCIDGTQIRIKKPKQNEVDYVNRKGYHSLNVQVKCTCHSIPEKGVGVPDFK